MYIFVVSIKDIITIFYSIRICYEWIITMISYNQFCNLSIRKVKRINIVLANNAIIEGLIVRTILLSIIYVNL